MSETAFPVNDLLRRKLQTSLALISLTTCVASTLFLLLFADQIGFGIMSAAEDAIFAPAAPAIMIFSVLDSEFLYL